MGWFRVWKLSIYNKNVVTSANKKSNFFKDQNPYEEQRIWHWADYQTIWIRGIIHFRKHILYMFKPTHVSTTGWDQKIISGGFLKEDSLKKKILQTRWKYNLNLKIIMIH